MTSLSRIQLDCQSCVYAQLKNMGLTLGAAISHMPIRMSKLKHLKGIAGETAELMRAFPHASN